jgi:phosphoglycerate dehydrogenase-like enzyme
MLQGKRVLIIGFGNIARELCPRLLPFGVRISALRRSPWGAAPLDPASRAAEAALEDRGTWPQDALRLAAEADVVVVTCKQDAANAGMVGADFLAACRPGVRLVNVARGGLLDYAAVAQALESGKIGGMGLDVQFSEPCDPDDYVARHPAVYLTPHVAGVTEQSCERPPAPSPPRIFYRGGGVWPACQSVCQSASVLLASTTR